MGVHSHIAANTSTLSVVAGLDFAAVGHARREGCAQDPSSFPSDCCCLQPNFRVTGRPRTGRWLRACIRHETDWQRLKDTGKPLALVSGWPHKLTRARAAGATFLLQTPHTGLVTALNFSAAGVLASGSEDTSVRVYKADYTGIAYVTPVSLSLSCARQLHRRHPFHTLACVFAVYRSKFSGHTDYVRDVAWLDDKTLLSCSWDFTVLKWACS